MFWDKKESDKLPDLPPLGIGSPRKIGEHTLPSFPDSPENKGFSQSAIKDAVGSSGGNDLPQLPNPNSDKMNNYSPEEEEVTNVPGKNFKAVEMEDWSPEKKQGQESMSAHQGYRPPENKSFERPKLQEVHRPQEQSVPQRQEHPQRHETERPEIHKSPEEIFNHRLIEPHPDYHRQKTHEHPLSEHHQSHEHHSSQSQQPVAIVKKESSGAPDVFIKIDKFHTVKKSLKGIRENMTEIDEMLKKIREIKMREEQELNAWEKELVSAKTQIQEVTENIFDKIE